MENRDNFEQGDQSQYTAQRVLILNTILDNRGGLTRRAVAWSREILDFGTGSRAVPVPLGLAF